MTIQFSPGPLDLIGTQAPVGTTGAQWGGPYVSGSDNPDAGPSNSFGGVMLRDMRYRSSPDGRTLAPGGYAKQSVGFVEGAFQTIDMVPATLSATNVAAAQTMTANTALTLAAASTGISVLAAAFTVLPTGLVVPAGALQIDAAPTWQSYGTSGAMQGWLGAACGRAVSLTSAANLSAINFTLVAYDVWGVLFHSTIAGPDANTVTFPKCAKWVLSITPNTTSASDVSAGTADVYEFPLMAQDVTDTLIWWAGTLDTGATGTFTAPDATSPATAATGDVRGKYAPASASNGANRLRVFQALRPANIATQNGAASVFGVVQA